MPKSFFNIRDLAQCQSNNTSNSEFLFFGPSLRVPRLARQINQIRNGSEALIITSQDFTDPSYIGERNLAASAEGLVGRLKFFGFNVNHVINPTKAEAMAAIARAAADVKKGVSPTDQFLLIFNCYADENNDFIMSDSRSGYPATNLSIKELENDIYEINEIQHFLFTGNFMKFPVITGTPQGTPQQTSQQQPQTYSSEVKGYVSGKIGLGVAYQPRLTLKVENPGTVVTQVCIDSKGKVTSVNINEKASKNYSTSTARAIEENLRRWTFNISVNRIQPNRECGEVVFQIK
jgi:hypothetical protein